MEQVQFQENLSNKNADISGLTQHLGLDGIDIDDIDVYGSIRYFLIPDIRSYGLDGIDVKIKSIEASITWSVYADELTTDELERCKAAGGVEYRNGKVEGQIPELLIIADDANWDIDTSECEFTAKGEIGIGNVQFELGDGKSKNQVTISFNKYYSR